MNDRNKRDLKKVLYLLIAISTAIRIFIASTLELSVDEVYYWTYALYPDLSHFDHPPMVGFIIQLFSFNLLFDSELALRLGAIIFSIFNTLIIYQLGKLLKNPLTGLYAAFLFNASIYCSVLAGNFIIPDTPQLLFWLLSLMYLLKSLPDEEITRKTRAQFLAACFFVGMAIFSKYHGVFIWVGIGLYVLFFDQRWLRQPILYVGGLLSVSFTLPVIFWNIKNDWISFNFHGERVASDFTIRLDYLFTEIFGQIAYNNPINYVIIIAALIAVYKGKLSIPPSYKRILFLNSLPIWVVFTSFSLFRQTLPHWTGPAFTALILIAALYLSDRTEKGRVGNPLFPIKIKTSVFLMYSLLIVAWVLINYFPGTFGKKDIIAKYGDTDFTLDMYGWDQIREGFEEFLQQEKYSVDFPAKIPIISPKYFPGTEIDYYVAKPLNMKVLQYGKLSDIHKYAWINKIRGELQEGEDAYMISTSNWYKDPFAYYSENFDEIIASDTIEINRSDKLAYYAFVYKLKGYKGNFQNPFNK